MSKPEFEKSEVLSAAVRTVERKTDDGIIINGFEPEIIATESAFHPKEAENPLWQVK